MAEYIPTTEQVREVFALAVVPSDGDQTVPKGEFDRWLATHDREVQARALQEARHAVRAMTPAPNSRLTWESAQSKAARTLLELEKALRTPDAGVGGAPAQAAPWEIRTNPDGSLDEVVATGARVHLEEMNHGQWWLGIDVGDRTLHVNFGVVNPRAKTYAHAEDAS